MDVELEVTYRVRYLVFASASLLLYDYTLTFEDELEYFWKKRPWTLTRVLFFVNRYMPMAVMGTIISLVYMPSPTDQLCDCIHVVNFVLSTFAVLVIQAIHAIRLWYLFSSRKYVRGFVLFAFAGSALASFAILGDSLSRRDLVTYSSLEYSGCQVPTFPDIWRLFLPTFIAHTIFFVLMLVETTVGQPDSRSSPLFQRLQRDGGLFYFVVFFSVGFSGIAAFLTNYPLINIPAIHSDFMLAATSVCMSRVMIATQDLAKTFGAELRYLLNPAEMSRVVWRRGAHGELFVDVNGLDAPRLQGHSLPLRNLRPSASMATISW